MARQTEQKSQSQTKKRVVQGAAAMGSAGVLAGIGELARRRRKQARRKTLAAKLRLRG